MASVRIRPDFTVELPDEIRGQVQPGDTVEVIVKGSRVSLRVRPAKPDLREIIARVRRNLPDHPLSEAEVEEIIHQTRRERR